MDLDVVKLVDPNNARDEEFFNKLEGEMLVEFKRGQIVLNDEWIYEMQSTIPYLEKAMKDPKKQLISEEEVIKMELIKKVSVESVKHLTKHVDFVDKFDEKTGEVTPSKLLNTYKEETIITYENRFLYTLIKLMEDFIFIRTKQMNEKDYNAKNYTKSSYEAHTTIRKEKVKVNFEYYSSLDTKAQKDESSMSKITDIKYKIKMLKSTELYNYLNDKRVTLVKAPLKMTNVLLKNPNFQYAVKLWNYLSDRMEMKNKSQLSKKEHKETGTVKKLINETFYLDYLVMSNLLEQNQVRMSNRAEDSKKEIDDLTNKLIEKIIMLNPEMAEKQLNKLIAEKYAVIKKRDGFSLKPLQEKYKQEINDYLTRVKELRLK